MCGGGRHTGGQAAGGRMQGSRRGGLATRRRQQQQLPRRSCLVGGVIDGCDPGLPPALTPLAPPSIPRDVSHSRSLACLIAHCFLNNAREFQYSGTRVWVHKIFQSLVFVHMYSCSFVLLSHTQQSAKLHRNFCLRHAVIFW